MAKDTAQLEEDIRRLQRRIVVPGGRGGEVLVRRFGRPYGAAWEAGAQLLFCRATESLTLTTTAQSITGDGDSSKVRLLLPTAGEWEITVAVDFGVTATGAGYAMAHLYVNDSGTPEDGQVVKSGSAVDRMTCYQQWKVTTTAANTPVELKARKTAAGGTATAETMHTTLVASLGLGGGAAVQPAADHGLLTGLGDDDHPQYLTPAEHTAVGDGSPHHAALTLAADAQALLNLSTQELGLVAKAANLIFAGPASGGAVDPTFRALVLADIVTAALGTGTPTGAKYLRDDRTWTVPAGGGDVVGPAGATDTALALFDGATGKLLKNSLVLCDASGNITGVQDLAVAGELSPADDINLLSGKYLRLHAAADDSWTFGKDDSHNINVRGSGDADRAFRVIDTWASVTRFSVNFATGDAMISGDLTAANIITAGNVDGRDVSTDGTKLDGIATGADVTGANPPQAHGKSKHTEFANWKLFHSDGSGDQQEIALGADGQELVSQGPAAAPAFEDRLHLIQVVVDGGGSVITTGRKAVSNVPFACTILGWTITCDDPWDTNVSIVIDVDRYTYANYPTTGGSIAGTEKPTISAAKKGQDLSLGTWTTTLAQYDQLVFDVESVTGAKRVTVSLLVKRT